PARSRHSSLPRGRKSSGGIEKRRNNDVTSRLAKVAILAAGRLRPGSAKRLLIRRALAGRNSTRCLKVLEHLLHECRWIDRLGGVVAAAGRQTFFAIALQRVSC